MDIQQPSSGGRWQDLVLAVHNHHTADCGQPPGIVTGPDELEYVGYFENELAEQWIVKINREDNTGVLLGGESGWDHPIFIDSGRLDDDLVLGPLELQWLDACWKAATGEAIVLPSDHSSDGNGD